MINEGYIDLFILGELFYHPYDFGLIAPGEHGYDSEACELEPTNMYFREGEETMSQLVISESAFSCMMHAFSQSPIGLIKLNAQYMNTLFKRDDLAFGTKSIEPVLPIFAEKLGENVTLELHYHMKDVVTHFSEAGAELEYTLCMRWFKHANETLHEVLYDEVNMLTSMDMDTENDIVYITLLTHKMDLSHRFNQRSQPIRNNMHLTENEYREFLSTFSLSLNWMKDWLNENYFRDGIFFPYNMSEF